jgi:hypothetical protein
MYSLLEVALSLPLPSMGYFVSIWEIYLIPFSCSWSTAELQVWPIAYHLSATALSYIAGLYILRKAVWQQ